MQLGLTTLSILLLYWSICCLCCVLCSDAKTRTGTYMKDRKNDDIPVVRTCKIRSLVLNPGKSSYPLPPEKKKLCAPATRFRVHGSRRDPDQCVRPRLSCPSTCCFAEKCSCEKKNWQKYEKLTNIRTHIWISQGFYVRSPTIRATIAFGKVMSDPC